MASKVKSASGSLERIFLLRLNGIYGELKALDTRIDSTEKGMDSLRSEPKAEIRAVAAAQGAKIDNVVVEVEQVGNQLDIDRRLALIEARMKEFEKRTRQELIF